MTRTNARYDKKTCMPINAAPEDEHPQQHRQIRPPSASTRPCPAISAPMLNVFATMTIAAIA